MSKLSLSTASTFSLYDNITPEGVKGPQYRPVRRNIKAVKDMAHNVKIASKKAKVSAKERARAIKRPFSRTSSKTSEGTSVTSTSTDTLTKIKKTVRWADELTWFDQEEYEEEVRAANVSPKQQYEGQGGYDSNEESGDEEEFEEATCTGRARQPMYTLKNDIFTGQLLSGLQSFWRLLRIKFWTGFVLHWKKRIEDAVIEFIFACVLAIALMVIFGFRTAWDAMW